MNIIQPLVILLAYATVVGAALIGKIDYRVKRYQNDWDTL